MTPDRFEAAKALLAKATPGPWTRKKPERITSGPAAGFHAGVAVAGTPGQQTIYANPSGGTFPSADCDLIVALRNMAPDLFALVEAAEAMKAKLREIEEHPVHQSVWAVAAIHGVHYEGPHYKEEMERLDAALATLRRGPSGEGAR